MLLGLYCTNGIEYALNLHTSCINDTSSYGIQSISPNAVILVPLSVYLIHPLVPFGCCSSLPNIYLLPSMVTYPSSIQYIVSSFMKLPFIVGSTVFSTIFGTYFPFSFLANTSHCQSLIVNLPLFL